MIRAASVFAVGCFASSLFGFAVGPVVADESPWPEVFREVTEVNVVNVDVVVTDKDGNPVLGLQPEDFEVLSNGDLVDITNFYAVQGGAVQSPVEIPEEDETAEEEAPERASEIPPELARLQVILFVDEANIGTTNRKRVFGKIREFLLAELPEDTEIMVVSHSTSMVVRQRFTSARHDIFAALAEAEKDSTVGPDFRRDQQRIIRAMVDINVEAGIPSLGVKGDGDLEAEDLASGLRFSAQAVLPQIRNYSQERYQHVLKTLHALRQFVDTAAGLPGRKAVVYISDGLPLRPAEGLYEAYARRFEALGGISDQVSPQGEASRDDATQAFQDLVAHANASAVTFYTLFSAPPAATQRGSAASAAGAGGNFGTFDLSVDSTLERTSQESLVLMAKGTGGRAGLALSALQGVLAGLVDDWNNRYSLGFEAQRLPSGALRNIKVRVAGKGLQVHYRESFREKSKDDVVAARTLSALTLADVSNPLGISLEVQEQTAEADGTYIVPLRVQVPLGKLVLLPGKMAHQAQVSMFVASRDAKGRTSEVKKHLCPIRIPNKEVLVALGRSATCGVQLRMRGGEQTLAVSVRDELAAIDSTARLDLNVPSTLETAELRGGS